MERHPLERLCERLRTGEALVAGVLSGTSADGIDVALVRFDGDAGRGLLRAPRVAAFETRAFPRALRARVRAVLDGAPTGLRETALLSRDLGIAFGQAVKEVARAAKDSLRILVAE